MNVNDRTRIVGASDPPSRGGVVVSVVLEDGTELDKTTSFADKMLATPGGLTNFVQGLPEHVLDAAGTITTHREVVLTFLGQRIGAEVEGPDRIVWW